MLGGQSKRRKKYLLNIHAVYYSITISYLKLKFVTFPVVSGQLSECRHEKLPVQCNTYPICDSPVQRTARRSFAPLTEYVAPKLPFFCVNRSPTRDGFRAGAKAIRQQSMNTYSICDSPVQRSTRRSFAPLAEYIALKSPFFCVNRSPTRYGFRAGAEAIRQFSMNTYSICDSPVQGSARCSSSLLQKSR